MPFFGPKGKANLGQSPLQELGEGPRSGRYLIFILKEVISTEVMPEALTKGILI